MEDRPLVALVVEDDAPVRQLLDAILQTLGWERVLGSSWEEVRAAAEWVDLVLVDHRLPGPSGLEILAEVKARRPELRTIMLSGDTAVRGRAQRLGVDGFLTKPFDVPDLIELLGRAEPTVDLRPAAPADIDVRTVDTPWFTRS